MATLRIERLFLSSRILLKWLEHDIVLTEQVLVLAQAFQQLSLGKFASSPALSQRCRHTLGVGFDAICAREFST